MIYIFDIDGTLADLSHRLHFIQQTPANWGEFFAACDEDKPIPEVVTVLQTLNSEGHFIVLITGRSTECEAKTVQWLADQAIAELLVKYEVLEGGGALAEAGKEEHGLDGV